MSGSITLLPELFPSFVDGASPEEKQGAFTSHLHTPARIFLRQKSTCSCVKTHSFIDVHTDCETGVQTRGKQILFLL